MLEMSRALLLNPELLLLLDEPSLGLERGSRTLSSSGLVAINKDGKSILIIEQNARRALKIADYAYVLDLGKVRFEGVASDIGSQQGSAEAVPGRVTLAGRNVDECGSGNSFR